MPHCVDFWNCLYLDFYQGPMTVYLHLYSTNFVSQFLLWSSIRTCLQSSHYEDNHYIFLCCECQSLSMPNKACPKAKSFLVFWKFQKSTECVGTPRLQRTRRVRNQERQKEWAKTIFIQEDLDDCRRYDITRQCLLLYAQNTPLLMAFTRRSACLWPWWYPLYLNYLILN